MDLTSRKQALLAAGDVRGLIGLIGIYGNAQMMARGYSGRADVLRTADGRDLRELFQELEQVADLSNASQQRFVDLFTFPATSPVTSVLQTLGAGPQFQDASEYGVPTSSRAATRPSTWASRSSGSTSHGARRGSTSPMPPRPRSWPTPPP